MPRSFATEPELEARLFRLLEHVWPGITAFAAEVGAVGASWIDVSTPFVTEIGDEIVSHVGLIELEIVDEGELRRVATLHAVATHPEHRRRGHYRRSMEDLLAFAADRFEALLLTTEHPEYFEAFGFEAIPEYVFDVPAELLPEACRGEFRPLQCSKPEDASLLRRVLAERAPVSTRLGVVRESAIFCFNELPRGLLYSRELDCVLAAEFANGHLALFDVVAPSLPRIDQVLERTSEPPSSCALHFAPDRLCPAASARQELFEHDGPSQLMVRGPLAARGRPLALPRSART